MRLEEEAKRERERIKNERNWIKLWIENKRNGDRETKLKYEISGEIEWIRKRN